MLKDQIPHHVIQLVGAHVNLISQATSVQNVPLAFLGSLNAKVILKLLKRTDTSFIVTQVKLQTNFCQL